MRFASPGGPFPNDNERGPQRRIAIEGRGAILAYLPAYSPDFNPIEQFFAKLKAVLRKLAAYTLKGAAYSIESLCKTYARLSLLALTKSLVLNVLPISLTQDLVNLNGKCSK